MAEAVSSEVPSLRPVPKIDRGSREAALTSTDGFSRGLS